MYEQAHVGRLAVESVSNHICPTQMSSQNPGRFDWLPFAGGILVFLGAEPMRARHGGYGCGSPPEAEGRDPGHSWPHFAIKVTPVQCVEGEKPTMF